MTSLEELQTGLGFDLAYPNCPPEAKGWFKIAAICEAALKGKPWNEGSSTTK